MSKRWEASAGDRLPALMRQPTITQPQPKNTMETNHLHKNITRLATMITSGIMITDNSDDDDEWTTSMHLHGERLSNHQIQMHISSLMENLKALNNTITNNQ